MTKKAPAYLRKLWHSYQASAVMLLNTLIVLLLLNGALALAFAAKDRRDRNPVSSQYGHEMVRAAYPDLDEQDMDALLQETWTRHYAYEPFTQFKEEAFQGRFVNVDAHGFRVTKNQGPWPPDSANLNVFLFGGSTTFGYGVADDQTLASYLQETLAAVLEREIRVYNFARGYYYSTQERILFQEVLVAGLVPDLAIFVDGLNDFYHAANEPLFTDRFRSLVQHETASSLKSLALATSLGRVVRGFGRKLAPSAPAEEAAAQGLTDSPDGTGRPADGGSPMSVEVVERYLANKRMIEAVAEPFGVTPIFVWQPVPTHEYDLQYHPFAVGGFEGHGASEQGYAYMAERVEANPLSDNFLWLAGIQKDEKQALYVDKVHYTAAFTRTLATRIAGLIGERLPAIQAPPLATAEDQPPTAPADEVGAG